MTVKQLIKILDKVPEQNMVLFKDDKLSKGWANITIEINNHCVFILPDKKPLFSGE